MRTHAAGYTWRVDGRYDLICVGAGTAGFAAADAARRLGKRVLLVSGPGDLGGTCILRGCMPAKTLLSSTERLAEVSSANDVGVRARDIRADLPAIVARKRELIDYFAEDRRHDLEAFPLVRGAARFLDGETLAVGERTYAGGRFVIATGSRIVLPEIPGLAACRPFTSDDALEMTSPPASLLVLGGGPVGCEFAQYFARLGTRVTLVQAEPTLLRNDDPDIGEAVGAFLTSDGIEILTGTDARAFEAEPGGGCTATLERGAERLVRRVERVMVATNRLPNVAGLDLARAGVVASERGIATDAYLRTTNPATFAAGDVLGRRCLVHVAAYAGALAARNAFADAPQPADFDRFEAHAVYTQPHVAAAGLTERACRARGVAIRVRRHPFVDIGKALVSGEPAGFVKMIAREDDGRILGVALVGNEAIDLVGEAIAFIDRGATVRDVAAMPHLHPALGEIFGRVAEDFEERQEPLPAVAGLRADGAIEAAPLG
jgi:pyruvate/2-oxoglutarate dehydrogenase complex dihydrolipoamide dehydrogenase (E3) component